MTAAEHAAAMVAFEERQTPVEYRRVTPQTWYRYGWAKAKRERDAGLAGPTMKEQGKADDSWWKGYQEGWK
jgi:hypothetical protein